MDFKMCSDPTTHDSIAKKCRAAHAYIDKYYNDDKKPVKVNPDGSKKRTPIWNGFKGKEDAKHFDIKGAH